MVGVASGYDIWMPTAGSVDGRIFCCVPASAVVEVDPNAEFRQNVFILGPARWNSGLEIPTSTESKKRLCVNNCELRNNKYDPQTLATPQSRCVSKTKQDQTENPLLGKTWFIHINDHIIHFHQFSVT